jgi:hypothetical protein
VDDERHLRLIGESIGDRGDTLTAVLMSEEAGLVMEMVRLPETATGFPFSSCVFSDGCIQRQRVLVYVKIKVKT